MGWCSRFRPSNSLWCRPLPHQRLPMLHQPPTQRHMRAIAPAMQDEASSCESRQYCFKTICLWATLSKHFLKYEVNFDIGPNVRSNFYAVIESLHWKACFDTPGLGANSRVCAIFFLSKLSSDIDNLQADHP